MKPLGINQSTKDEREHYIKTAFPCKSDCENCGICKVLRGKSAEVAYAEYIDGTKEFAEIAAEYRYK